jgi:hypothetical protein
MRVARGLAALCAVGFGIADVQAAETWGPPSPEYASYGIGTIICNERAQDGSCLGLACIEGALALVNMAGGGGPVEGATRVSTGRNTLTLKFVWDEGAVDKLGLAASAADLTLAQFETLSGAASITLTMASDSSIRHRFTTRGISAEWLRVARSCR